MKNRIFLLAFLFLFVLFISCSKNQQDNSLIKFDFDWKFSLGNYPGAYETDFDDSDWRILDVPHDFSIEQPFDSLNPSGTGGGYAFGGIGWYRKHFVLDETYLDKKVSILFNGVYRNSEVWINGKYLGFWPYGYTSFYYDLTPYLNPTGQENVLAVKVNTTGQPNSRWYTGAGIYRHVWLKAINKIHFKHWGVFASTSIADKQKATINISIELINEKESEEICEIISCLETQKRENVGHKKETIKIIPGDTILLNHEIEVKNPELWSIDHPYLYQLNIDVKIGNKIIDNYNTPFGIRTYQFDPDKGFILNGEHIRLKGANNHHDGGPLGAACMDYTFERQLKILKEMGCNAIRTSHNPPAPELLEAADRMGFLVIDEIFDEWLAGKTKAGYSAYFTDWYKKDVENWMARDRNHPSVIAWSIGNEVGEQWNMEGTKVVKMLLDECVKYDTTRPFTAGCNGVPRINETGFGDLLDIVGYQYQEANYIKDHKTYPKRIIYASETVNYPYQPGDCFQMHSYKEWLTGQFADFIAGEFIWTGFDYLGEAGIGEGGTGCNPWDYWPKWPWRGATCGVIDICGFEKPGYWFRKALWSNEPIVFIAVETNPSAKNIQAVPFWGWPEVQHHWNHSSDGDTLAVHVYTNVPDVELFLNGKSLGAKNWDIQKEAFLTWDVPFKKGKLKAIGTLANGDKVTNEVLTAGQPSKIKLITDRKTMKANKQDIAYIQAVILDENSIPVPFANNEINFEVTGAGKLIAVGSANQTSHIPFKGNKTGAYQGKCLAIVQSMENPGKIIIKAISKSIQGDQMEVITK